MTPEERFERIERNLDRVAQEQATQAEIMTEIHQVVIQIGQQTLTIGQRLTELINALRHGDRNGKP
jgi:hypothetical protein